MYIPPQGSKYATDDPYLEIQEELFRYCSDIKHVLLFGDFNSRCKTLPDFVKFDEYISDMYGLQQLYDENINVLSYFEKYNVPLDRNSADETMNSYGYGLLDLCKNKNLFILNGRLGTDYLHPSLTCKNKSTIDYFISSAYVLPSIKEFHVGEFSPLFSDVHSPVTLTIGIEHVRDTTYPKHTEGEQMPKLWNPDKCESFIDNIDILKISEIQMQLDKIHNSSKVTKCEIDEIVLKIGSLFDSSCRETFGMQNVFTNNKQSGSKPWFNTQCTRARNIYHKARKAYNRYKTSYYKNILKIVSKRYKNTLTLYSNRFTNDKIKRLRSLKNKNPREYWKIINSQNESGKVKAPLNDFYDFYKTVNQNCCESANLDFESEVNKGHGDRNADAENEINHPVTESEILQNVKSLKNNKSPGADSVINEHIKSTIHMLLPVYVKLFNLILDTGIIPESWTIGIIKPIYKQKGDPKLPENYRPIILLCCFGKLFTSIINNRLNKYAENYNVINWNQAGFRKEYSTSDNLFILKSLIDIIQSQHKKLYCCFVDFKQAFDTVWRVGLWQKLQQHGVRGKCFKLIFNLYKDIKSKVMTHEGSTEFFSCHIGVRQGENLSPFLFTIFLNDLEQFLGSQNVNGIKCDINSNDIAVFLKLLILLYADDTVLFSDNETDLQHSLVVFEDYCQRWKLNVNTSKTKIVIFGRGKLRKSLSFKFQNNEIEIVTEYKYLGIIFSRSGSFAAAKKHIAEQGNKAVFALLRKINSLSLPFDIQIELFNKTIKPILLYGCEIWGVGKNDIIERVQLKYFKHIFYLKKSTPSYMIYGELGIKPIQVDIETRTIAFWAKLIEADMHNKLSSAIYTVIYEMTKEKKIKSFWIENIKTLLCSLGFSGIWYSQSFFNKKWLVKAVHNKLNDLFIQKWLENIRLTSNSNFYKIFKTTFQQSNYFSQLSTYYCKKFIRFRTRNHRFPVETGRWRSIPFDERKCHLCEMDIGDEFHYLLVCSYFRQERQNYLKPYYYIRPNTLKLEQLMNIKNVKSLRNLCKFIDIITKSAAFA